MPLQLFLTLYIIAVACPKSSSCILRLKQKCVRELRGGGQKQTNRKKQMQIYVKKENPLLVFDMARAVENLGRFIRPIPEFHRKTYRLSEAIKIEIVRLHRNDFGTPYRIAKHLKISKDSVIRWTDRYEEERNLQAKVNANGRPSLTTENEDFLITCSGSHLNFYS
jgi:hypothetical protein